MLQRHEPSASTSAVKVCSTGKSCTGLPPGKRALKFRVLAIGMQTGCCDEQCTCVTLSGSAAAVALIAVSRPRLLSCKVSFSNSTLRPPCREKLQSHDLPHACVFRSSRQKHLSSGVAGSGTGRASKSGFRRLSSQDRQHRTCNETQQLCRG